MNLPLTGYLQKLTDNAHLGKIATDISAGMVLTVGILLLIGATSDISIMPYQQHVELTSQERALSGKLQQRVASVHDLIAQMPEPLAKEAQVYAGDIDTETPAEVLALVKTQLEAVAPRVETALQAQIAALECPRGAGAAAGCKALEEDLAGTQVFPSRFNTRVALMLTTRDKLAETSQKRRDCIDLWKNIDYLVGPSQYILAIAGVFGVVMSQISRELIFRLLFRWFRKQRWFLAKPVVDKTGDIIEALAKGQVNAERHENLVTEYFRYAEASVNMVIPMIVFGVGISVYGARVEVVAVPYWVATLAGGFVCAFFLSVSGYRTYMSYLEKINLLLVAAGVAPKDQAVPETPDTARRDAGAAPGAAGGAAGA